MTQSATTEQKNQTGKETTEDHPGPRQRQNRDGAEREQEQRL